MSWYLDLGSIQIAVAAVVALGSGVGIIAGMFGVGGGFLLIPLLHVILDVPLHLVVGAVLCQTIAISMGSLIRFRRMGHAETRLDILLIGGSILGVLAGSELHHHLARSGSLEFFGKTIPLIDIIVSSVFCFFYFAVALLLWFKHAPSVGDSIRPGPLARAKLPPLIDFPVAGLTSLSAPLIAYVGLLLGILSGLLGIAGGVLLMPVMLYGFGFNIRKAAGTGIAMVLVVSLLGTLRHSLAGNVHLGLATTLMVGSALAAQVGAGLTHRLNPIILRKALAIMIVAANVALLLKVFA
jgi:uncharacterized membrane protein YfcA